MRQIIVVILLLIPLICFGQQNDTIPRDSIYTKVDTPPSFPTGDYDMFDYIERRYTIDVPTVYQNRVAQNGYYTIVKFIVDKNGKIHDLQEDSRSKDFYLVDYLQQIFYNMPTWKPGKVKGAAVNTLVYLELDFRYVDGDIDIRYHTLYPDSLVWTKHKMSKKQKMWGVLAAAGLIVAFILVMGLGGKK